MILTVFLILMFIVLRMAKRYIGKEAQQKETMRISLKSYGYAWMSSSRIQERFQRYNFFCKRLKECMKREI